MIGKTLSIIILLSFPGTPGLAQQENREDFAQYFADHKTEACIIVRRLSDRKTWIYNARRCETQFILPQLSKY